MSEIRWFDLLREFFGVNLPVDRAATWVRLMNEPDALSDASEDELCDVLRWVRKKREGDEYRKNPTLEMLIGWVKWYRKIKAEARRGVTDGDDGFLGHIKNAMLKAEDNDERWEIMCDPTEYGASSNRDTTASECDRLCAWAKTRWPDFGPPQFYPLPLEKIGHDND